MVCPGLIRSLIELLRLYTGAFCTGAVNRGRNSVVLGVFLYFVFEVVWIGCTKMVQDENQTSKIMTIYWLI